MIADTKIDFDLTHKQATNRKVWLTSSEAIDYIKANCPGLWKCTFSRLEQKYSPLYRMAREEVVESYSTFTNGSQCFRFYNKACFDKLEERFPYKDRLSHFKQLKEEVENLQDELYYKKKEMKEAKNSLRYSDWWVWDE